MAFQQGLSGLNATSRALDVVGNNVANSSTVGFKSANGHFADIYASSMSGAGASQIGIGTTLSAVFQQFTQGNITSTNNPLDIAINGNGFFSVTRDGSVNYTRNGQFHADYDGYIVNDQNFKLMGYMATPAGAIVPSVPSPIQIDTSNIPPRPTGDALGGDAEMVLNLDAGASVPSVATFNHQDPLSYTYSTAQEVFDTLGVAHNIRYYFVKTSTPGQWDLHATLDGANPQSMGSLNFNTSGQLTTAMPVSLPTTWAITTGATSPLGTGLPNWQIDFSGTTNFSGPSTVNSNYQGGYAQGALSGLSINSDGVIQGNYSNGQTKNMAQIVLATFANPNGLVNLGSNLFQATPDSGAGLIGTPGSGARGVLSSTSVEESNVDLTNELVNMIILQRNYQANAQSIKTQDQIMQTLVNLR